MFTLDRLRAISPIAALPPLHEWIRTASNMCALCLDPTIATETGIDVTDLPLCRTHVDEELARILEWERDHEVLEAAAPRAGAL